MVNLFLFLCRCLQCIGARAPFNYADVGLMGVGRVVLGGMYNVGLFGDMLWQSASPVSSCLSQLSHTADSSMWFETVHIPCTVQYEDIGLVAPTHQNLQGPCDQTNVLVMYMINSPLYAS